VIYALMAAMKNSFGEARAFRRTRERKMTKKAPCLFIIMLTSTLILTASLQAAATVTISNEYFTAGGEVNDDVYLDGVGYDSDIDIDSSTIKGTGTAATAEGKVGRLVNRITFSAPEMGALLDLKGEGLGVSKGFASSSLDSSASISYRLADGTSEAAVYNSYARIVDSLVVKGSIYESDLSITPEGMTISGEGKRDPSDPAGGSVVQTMYLWYRGDWAKTYLSMDEITESGDPLDYYWTANAFVTPGAGATSMNFAVNHGDRMGHLVLTGTGNLFSDSEGYEADIDEGEEGVETQDRWWMNFALS